jgi:hypothetical protein
MEGAHGYLQYHYHGLLRMTIWIKKLEIKSILSQTKVDITYWNKEMQINTNPIRRALRR